MEICLVTEMVQHTGFVVPKGVTSDLNDTSVLTGTESYTLSLVIRVHTLYDRGLGFYRLYYNTKEGSPPFTLYVIKQETIFTRIRSYGVW